MYEIKTERLLLRRVTADDTKAVFDTFARDPEVTKYLTWEPHEDISVTEEIMQYWLKEYKKDNCYRYVLERLSDNAFMGMIDVVGFHHGNEPIIGYCMGKIYWNNGYMTEAFHSVLDRLFSDGYDTVLIEAAADNIGSNRVIQKNGFRLISWREDALSESKPEPVTINTYRLRREEW